MQLDLEEQKRFWNSWDSRYREQHPLDPMSERRGETVVEWLRKLGLKQPRILEVGCANGWLSERLSALGSVTATDLADEVVDRAQTRLPQVRFLAGDFLDLDFGAGAFDVVICLETISCIADQQRFVDGIARVLRPGGHLILTTHNRFVFERMDDVAPLAPGQVRKWLSKEQLRQLLKKDFRLLRLATIGPAGRKGILRFVNSYKLDTLFTRIAGSARLRRAKELLGFGQTTAVLCRRVAR